QGHEKGEDINGPRQRVTSACAYFCLKRSRDCNDRNREHRNRKRSPLTTGWPTHLFDRRNGLSRVATANRTNHESQVPMTSITNNPTKPGSLALHATRKRT